MINDDDDDDVPTQQQKIDVHAFEPASRNGTLINTFRRANTSGRAWWHTDYHELKIRPAATVCRRSPVAGQKRLPLVESTANNRSSSYGRRG